MERTIIDIEYTKERVITSRCRMTEMIKEIFRLRNIGATCYMNSILQCLLNIDPFRYDLMVTNSELITSALLHDNSIYL